MSEVAASGHVTRVFVHNNHSQREMTGRKQVQSSPEKEKTNKDERGEDGWMDGNLSAQRAKQKKALNVFRTVKVDDKAGTNAGLVSVVIIHLVFLFICFYDYLRWQSNHSHCSLETCRHQHRRPTPR